MVSFTKKFIRKTTKIRGTMKKIFFYLPRVLSVLIGLLLISMGVFGLVSEPNFQSLVGFLAVLVVLFITYIAWKNPLLGGTGYLFLGLAFILAPYLFSRIKPSFNWITTLPALTGLLFLIDGLTVQNKTNE